MRYRLRLDRLEQLLSRSRVSQNHWAMRLGLSRGHWSDLRSGKHPFPSATTREPLAEKNRRVLRILVSIVAALVIGCFWVGTRW